VEPLIGFFVNSLVLRTDLAGDPTFSELLRRVRDVVLEADAHQDLPFEKLVEELQPERNMYLNPLFQVSLQYFSGQDRESPGVAMPVESLDVDKGTANIDLAFDMMEVPAGLLTRIEYSTELFEDATIRRLAERFRTLLEAVVRDPNRRLSELPLIPVAER